jgi:hypothetical protein
MYMKKKKAIMRNKWKEKTRWEINISGEVIKWLILI